MDPVVSQFLIGAIVPGAASTAAMAAAWMSTKRRGAAALPAGRLLEQSDIAEQEATQSRLRALAFPVLVALAVGFAQSPVVTDGWKFPPVDAYSWLGTIVLIAAAVGGVVAIVPKVTAKAVIAAIGVTAGLVLAAVTAKLDLVGGAIVVAAGLVFFAGLPAALRRPGLGGAVFLWLLLVTCSQTLILAFSSLRLGVLVHCIAAVGGGVMVAALIWPRVRVGTAGAATLAIVLGAVFAQGYSLGSDSTPLWVRLGAVSLLVLCPAVFGAAMFLLHGRMRPLGAALTSLAIAAVPAAIALAVSAWAYLNIADSAY